MSIKYQAVVLRYCRISKVTNDIAVDLATFRSYIQLIRLPSSVLVEGRVTKDLNIFCETEGGSGAMRVAALRPQIRSEQSLLPHILSTQ